MHSNIHSSTIHNRQGMEKRKCPSTDEWIKKLWQIHTTEYYSAITMNAFELALMRWMNLEPIIQSEVSQKEKDKNRILTHIYGIQKNGTEKFIYRAAMEKQTQRIDLQHGERGGEGEVDGKSNMETYITICKIDSQGEFAVQLWKLKQGLQINLGGGMEREIGRSFKREGIYVYLWLVHVEDLTENNKIL